jgi:coenzyme F420-reducing hydrogenase beta subunit
LFVGTTCQVNGLKNYLKKDYDKLYCIDFICLGVPSPMIWKDYLNTYFDEEEIESINFKEKSLGWHMFSLNIKSKRKNFVKNGRKTYYYTGYFRHLYTRPSCSNCTYKIGNRCSDITISDCWGSQKIAPEMDDDKGMSSIVCHSKKGKQLFDEIKNQTKWKCADIEDILEFNSGYRKSVAESELRDCFWNDYRKLDKGKLFKKYCTPEKNDIFHRIARKIKRIMKK